jgi:hypothetical protein
MAVTGSNAVEDRRNGVPPDEAFDQLCDDFVPRKGMQAGADVPGQAYEKV